MDITKIIIGLHISASHDAPLYVQLANCLAAKIKDSTLPRGTKLPPERELAKMLKVSRTTTLSSYRLLEERGLIQSKMGSGTYVNDSTKPTVDGSMAWEQLFSPQYKSPMASLLRTLIATPTAEETISLAAGMPDPSFYPLDLIELAFTKRKDTFTHTDYGYIATEGYFPLRQAIAKWQSQFGSQATPDQILIVSGSQQGLYLTVKAFIEQQDYVIVESPTYLGAIQALEAAGARILTLPDSDHLDLELLEDYLIRYRPKLMYTIPTFQNPTGRVMSLDDRQALIELAARYRLVIIEDDPYSLLYYEKPAPPSLKSLDTYGGVIYIGTFSKTLLPGLRTGWVTAAQPVINRLAQEKQHVDLHSNNLAQFILLVCIEENILADHLTKVRSEYKKRRDAMVHALRRYCKETIDFSVPAGGFYIWCKIKHPLSVTELMHRAAVSRVAFVPGIAFYTNGTHSNEIRLCFATHNEELLKEGIRRIGQLLMTLSTNKIPPCPAAGLPLI